MKKLTSVYLLTIVGVALFISGVYFIKTSADPQGIMQILPHIFVGLGCVIFGYGLGEIVVNHAMNKDPNAAKEFKIEKNDERNKAIANRAKAKAYDLMVFVFGALILAFSLMAIDLSIILLLVFSYLIILVFNSYYRFKYYKEM